MKVDLFVVLAIGSGFQPTPRKMKMKYGRRLLMFEICVLFGTWCLGFGICLVLDVWDLGFI
jgi:hypothetical protein